MYGNQCSGAMNLGIAPQERQREVNQAIGTAHAEFESLEYELGSLLSRLEVICSHKPSDCKDSPSPAYATYIGGRIGELAERIASARRRIQQACADLEV